MSSQMKLLMFSSRRGSATGRRPGSLCRWSPRLVLPACAYSVHETGCPASAPTWRGGTAACYPGKQHPRGVRRNRQQLGVASPWRLRSGVASPRRRQRSVASPRRTQSGVASPRRRQRSVASPRRKQSGVASPRRWQCVPVDQQVLLHAEAVGAAVSRATVPLRPAGGAGVSGAVGRVLVIAVQVRQLGPTLPAQRGVLPRLLPHTRRVNHQRVLQGEGLQKYSQSPACSTGGGVRHSQSPACSTGGGVT